MTDEINLNAHNKDEYPPMHTVEHILNRTMINMFGCERSANAHIERKKSKCDYHLDNEPTKIQIQEIEQNVNAVISSHLDVTIEFVNRTHIPSDVDLSKLPEDASETLRLVHVGKYDVCACIGTHVKNTKEIAPFKIISSNWNNGIWRVRFKLLENQNS